MPRLSPLLTVAAALGPALTGAACSPEVVIARSQDTGGAGGGGTSSTGMGDAPASLGAGTDAVGEGGEGGMTTAELARLLADSVADFSLTQGEHGWYYGYDGGSLDSFTLMTHTSLITTYVPATNDVWDCWANDSAHWTQLFQLGAHANGTDTSPPSAPILQRAVRRWLSNFEGDVTISGELAKIDVEPGSNGVDGSVYVDGALLYTAFIGGADGGGLSYDVAASLKLGSTVDFVLDPHDSDDHHDLSRFTGVIARAAVPHTP